MGMQKNKYEVRFHPNIQITIKWPIAIKVHNTFVIYTSQDQDMGRDINLGVSEVDIYKNNIYVE